MHRPPHRTNWTGWYPGQSSETRQLRRTFTRWARCALVAFIVLAAAAAYGLYDAQRSRDLACHNLNDTRSALRTIIARGDRNLTKLRDEKTLTEGQYIRSLRESARARHQLRRIHCGDA